jgi:hypothetical protein
MSWSTGIGFITTASSFHAFLPCRAAVVPQDPRLHAQDHPAAPPVDRVAVAEAQVR